MKFLFVLAAAMLMTVAVPTQAGDNPARGYVRALNETSCSGVVIQPGVVLTASHCVRPDVPLTLTPGGPTAHVVANGDDRLDYAILRFPESAAMCPCAPIAAREAEREEAVYVVGFPSGMAVQILTTGTSQGVQENPRLPYGRRLVTTAPVAGGNSGGGVFVLRDGEYRLVGVLVEALGTMSFAVPLADLYPFLASNLWRVR